MRPTEEGELLRLLQSAQQKEVDRAFRLLYQEQYPILSSYISKRNGQVQDVDDILQEGLLVLYKLARQNKLQGINKLQNYLFTICKNFWFRKQQQKGSTVELDDQAQDVVEEPTVLQHIFAEERSQLLKQVLEQLGEGCQKLLVLFYYERLSMKEILQHMHYASEAALKNKKSKCMKKLKELFEQVPQLKKRILQFSGENE